MFLAAASSTGRTVCAIAVCSALLLPILRAAGAREAAAHDLGQTPPTADGRAFCTLGDISFRNAEFERAAQCYRNAVAADPSNARAHLGLGRVARLQFQRRTAYQNFANAFRLDSTDPDILLAYSDYASKLPDRTTLYAALSGPIYAGDSRVRQAIAK